LGLVTVDTDTILKIVTAVVAVWGAITGTIALSTQLLQLRRDRTDLKLQPQMTIRSSINKDLIDAIEMIDFQVEVVNVGRRVARIDEVGIHIKGRAKLQDKHGLNIIVFNGKEDGIFSLQEGEKKVFEMRRWPRTLQDMAEHFADEESVYVRLTSGKQYSALLRTLSMSKLKAAREKAQLDAAADAPKSAHR
jgi:hypothetical protein